MSEPEKTSIRLKVDDVGKIPSMVDPHLNGDNPHSVAIVAIARFENLYINEWIDYHRKLGFSHFYVYDNSWGDEVHLDKVISGKNMEVTTIIPAYDMPAFQHQAYTSAYNMYGNKHDYMLFIDIDEFFTLMKHDNVSDYIDYLEDKCCGFQDVRIHWEIYDDNNALERDVSIPVVEFFTQLASTTTAKRHNLATKCLIKTGMPEIFFDSPHYAKSKVFGMKFISCDSFGRQISPQNQQIKRRDISVAKIRHYSTKTLSEYMNLKLFHPDGCWYVKESTLGNRFFRYCRDTKEKRDYYEKYMPLVETCSERVNGKKNVVKMVLNHGNIQKCLHDVCFMLNNPTPPYLIFLELDPEDGIIADEQDFSRLVELTKRNPRVKFLRGVSFSDICDEDEYHIVYLNNKYLDMTMISVFYDAGINTLRKNATRQAVQKWMLQKSLPKEMIFLELGFDGVFTFSASDFPKEIQYVRINGTESNKYLFQKEHLWNIAAKMAHNQKLMFVDSDISPLTDVDWFGQVYDALDKCIFTQGFSTITYLKEDGGKYVTKNGHVLMKESYTHMMVKNMTPSTSVAVPGGVYCIKKPHLELIGGFNYLPFGGGDTLFWNEIAGLASNRTWVLTLHARKQVANIFSYLQKTSNLSLLSDMDVNVVHFHHGNFTNRSYVHRDYLLAAHYPWKGTFIDEDNQGLLSWIDNESNFKNIMSILHTLKDNTKAVSKHMLSEMKYEQFYDNLCKLQDKLIHSSKFDIANTIRKNISVCLNR